MSIFKFVLLMYILCIIKDPAAGQKSVEGIKSVNTLEDKVYGLSLLWSEIKYNFVNIDRLDFDVDSLYRETMQRVLTTKNDVEYYKELRHFLIAFNDAHTQLLREPESGYEDTDYPKYGTKLFGDKFYFVTYRSEREDVDPRLLGAEIIEIEGLPAMKYAEKYVMPYITASTENYRRNLAGTWLLNGETNTYIKGKALKSDGEIIPFNIIRNGEATRVENEEDYWIPKPKKRENKAVQCDWKGKIAVLTINTFFPELVSNEIDSVMRIVKSKQPAGLIIDLRDNGGGRTDVANRLLMHLTQADSIRSFAAQSRTNLGYGRAQGNYREEYEDYFKYKSYKTFPVEMIEKDKNIEPIQCPVVVLIGTYSFSACEDFLINIYEMPRRPILIGEETAGSTGAPLVVFLPHEAIARICTLRVLYPYSLKPFVGQGILPDIEVKPTIDDYLNGTDVVMRRALGILDCPDIEIR